MQKTGQTERKKQSEPEDSLKDIISLCKRRGFIYQGSEIYGGLANTFDYGPYGVELLRNLKNEWWHTFVSSRSDIVGLDSSIFLHPKAWEASGHLDSFHDPLSDCKHCQSRIRADQYLKERQDIDTESMSLSQIQAVFQEKGDSFHCPQCGKKGTFTKPRQFNLMFSTKMGSVLGENDMEVYLRPETAQGIFLNFRNISSTCRVNVPFGVAQIGKSFRNEITARQFIFRTREFEQMEIEFFCKPGTQKKWFDYWVDSCTKWLDSLGVCKKNLRLRSHEKKELSFYSENTVDIEYNFPFGWGELWGIASRTDYDLRQHSSHSKKNLNYFDAEKGENWLPYVIEPALGLNRLFLCILADSYHVENPETKEKRTVLKLASHLSPVKAGIFPLQKKDGLLEIAEEIHKKLYRSFAVELDSSGSIGKRYYRQDELGTPYCITVDYQTKEDQTITLRKRDSMSQKRIPIEEIHSYLLKKLQPSIC